MILNERQYGITKTKVREFEGAIAKLSQSPEAVTLNEQIRHQAHLDTLTSQLEEFNAEIKEYEELKQGNIKSLKSFTKILGIQKALNLEVKEELIFKESQSQEFSLDELRERWGTNTAKITNQSSTEL